MAGGGGGVDVTGGAAPSLAAVAAVAACVAAGVAAVAAFATVAAVRRSQQQAAAAPTKTLPTPPTTATTTTSPTAAPTPTLTSLKPRVSSACEPIDLTDVTPKSKASDRLTPACGVCEEEAVCSCRSAASTIRRLCGMSMPAGEHEEAAGGAYRKDTRTALDEVSNGSCDEDGSDGGMESVVEVSPAGSGQRGAECTPDRVKPDPYNPSKRADYLSWHDYFMAIAFLSARRSKDPNKQVGACIVNNQNIILGIGYNGFPRGCSDDALPWAKVSHDGDILNTKYPYVCHAEVNAILNKNQATVAGQRLYVTMFPCNECAKLVIQAGIAEIIYFEDKSNVNGDEGGAGPDPIYAASKRLLKMAGIKVWQHKPAAPFVMLDFY